MTSDLENPQELIGRGFLYQVAEQALNPADRHFLSQAVTGVLFSFRWRDTAEGFDYWADVYKKLKARLDATEK